MRTDKVLGDRGFRFLDHISCNDFSLYHSVCVHTHTPPPHTCSLTHTQRILNLPSSHTELFTLTHAPAHSRPSGPWPSAWSPYPQANTLPWKWSVALCSLVYEVKSVKWDPNLGHMIGMCLNSAERSGNASGAWSRGQFCLHQDTSDMVLGS